MITSGTVHLWLGDITSHPSKTAWLSPLEQQRAAAFVTETLQARYRASVIMLRSVLARYLDCAPEAISFKTGPQGKPYVHAPESSLQFNFSHSHERAMLAVTMQQEVGVDLEHHRTPLPDLLALAERFFAPDEFRALQRCGEDERSAVFYRLWTRKEAFLKATGQGIAFGLNQFTVSTKIAGWDNLLTLQGSRLLAAEWSLGSILSIEQDYTAALALAGPIENLQFQHWRAKDFAE